MTSHFVQVLKRPRFDLGKLLDIHGEGTGKGAVAMETAEGEVVTRPEGYEPPVLDAV
jgi:small subunit ribosomal protein S3Ae